MGMGGGVFGCFFLSFFFASILFVFNSNLLLFPACFAYSEVVFFVYLVMI